MTDEFYISVDCETDGPLPGINSMLSLGAAAFTSNGHMFDSFYTNIYSLTGAVRDAKTMAWWELHQKAWEDCRANPILPPDIATERFRNWINSAQISFDCNQKIKPVCIAYPASFDYSFVHYYLVRFVTHDPFGFSALDIKTYAMAVLGSNFKDTVKRNMPRDWFDDNHKHTHNALDDAIEQGHLFFKIKAEREKMNLVLNRNEFVVRK